MNFDVIPYLLSSETGKVQYSIDSRILNLQILEMIVTTNNGSVTDFDEIAATLCKDDPAVRSLQLSPDGVVSYIYPTEAGENDSASSGDALTRKLSLKLPMNGCIRTRKLLTVRTLLLFGCKFCSAAVHCFPGGSK